MAEALDHLIATLTRLPGIGRRSAERIAFALLRDPDGMGAALLRALDHAVQTLTPCRLCGNITARDQDPCAICSDPRRENSVLCVVEEPGDILLMERARAFKGRYHALMGRLSPMRGESPKSLRIEALLDRVRREGIREVILALNSDVEGDATASYLTETLRSMGVAVTRPARGIPAGSGLAYMDAVTLARALELRQPW